MDIFYVYCYFDGETPIYIGKGSHGRMRDHLTSSSLNSSDSFFYRKLRKMLREGRTPTYRKLLTGLPEEEAFYYERFFIAAIGRRVDGEGPLCNVTWGGDRSNTGYRHSEERKAKIGKGSVNKWRDPTIRNRICTRMREAHAKRPLTESQKASQQKGMATYYQERIRRLRAGSISWRKKRKQWAVTCHQIYVGQRATYVEAEKLRVDYCKALRDGWVEEFMRQERENRKSI